MAEEDDLAPVGGERRGRDRGARLWLASIEPTETDKELAWRDLNDTGNAERFVVRWHVSQRGLHHGRN